MRHRDPHDDPPAKRRPEPYRGPPVTLAHMRAQGVRRLLIYCPAGLYCHHSGTVDADRWPDETALRDLCPKAVCTQCGIIGAVGLRTSLRGRVVVWIAVARRVSWRL
jgi:hypothetical protein